MAGGGAGGPKAGRAPSPPQVSNAAMEFLVSEVLRYVASATPPEGDSEEQAIFAKEMAAAKIERMGYGVGYRLSERLAQNRTFNANTAGKEPAMAAAAAQLEAVKLYVVTVTSRVPNRPRPPPVRA